MNAPARLLTPAPVTGWADHRTRQAYDLLEALYRSFGPDRDSDAASAVYEAMEAVEAADCAVGGGL